MSTTTANLGLFKYNTTTDANVAFNINTALNDNWDKIDTAMAGGGLPDQTGKDGYILTTNGSEASWGQTSEVHCVIETFVDGTSWYRVYSDGWCEQGGRYANSNSGTKNFTFLKPFIDNNYYLSCSATYTSSGNTNHQESMNEFVSKTVDGFTKYIWANNNNFYWQACGYIEV